MLLRVRTDIWTRNSTEKCPPAQAILLGDQPVQMVIHVPVEFRLVDNG